MRLLALRKLRRTAGYAVNSARSTITRLRRKAHEIDDLREPLGGPYYRF